MAQGVGAVCHLPPYLFLLSVALFPLRSRPRRATRQSDHAPPCACVSAELGKSRPLRPSCGHSSAACPTCRRRGKGCDHRARAELSPWPPRGPSLEQGSAGDSPGGRARSSHCSSPWDEAAAPISQPTAPSVRWVEEASGQRIKQQLPGKQKPCLHRTALGALAQAAVAWPWGAAAHPDLLLAAPRRRQPAGRQGSAFC